MSYDSNFLFLYPSATSFMFVSVSLPTNTANSVTDLSISLKRIVICTVCIHRPARAYCPINGKYMLGLPLNLYYMPLRLYVTFVS